MPPLQHHAERLQKRFIVAGKNECWPWRYSHYRNCSRGRGGIPIPKEKYGDAFIPLLGSVPAHRAVYLALVGEIPIGMIVCHSCDTPHCVNPNHLFIGTYEDNAKDMAAKGRGRLKIKDRIIKFPSKQVQRPGNRGSKNGNCTMTEGEVQNLRADRACGMNLSQLSERYGCSVSSASRLCNFKTHKT